MCLFFFNVFQLIFFRVRSSNIHNLDTKFDLPFRNLNFLRRSAPTKESQRYKRSPLKNTPSQLTLLEWGLELM
jgi:hypothetical protein